MPIMWNIMLGILGASLGEAHIIPAVSTGMKQKLCPEVPCLPMPHNPHTKPPKSVLVHLNVSPQWPPQPVSKKIKLAIAPFPSPPKLIKPHPPPRPIGPFSIPHGFDCPPASDTLLHFRGAVPPPHRAAIYLSTWWTMMVMVMMNHDDESSWWWIMMMMNHESLSWIMMMMVTNHDDDESMNRWWIMIMNLLMMMMAWWQWWWEWW